MLFPKREFSRQDIHNGKLQKQLAIHGTHGSLHGSPGQAGQAPGQVGQLAKAGSKFPEAGCIENPDRLIEH